MVIFFDLSIQGFLI